MDRTHPHLHGLLAGGYWIDGVFTRFSEVDLKPIEQAFDEHVLAQLHKRELITDDDVASTGSAEQRRSSLRSTLALAYLSSGALAKSGRHLLLFLGSSTVWRAQSSHTALAMVRQAHHYVDEIPSYDSFEPLEVSNVEPPPDDF